MKTASFNSGRTCLPAGNPHVRQRWRGRGSPLYQHRQGRVGPERVETTGSPPRGFKRGSRRNVGDSTAQRRRTSKIRNLCRTCLAFLLEKKTQAGCVIASSEFPPHPTDFDDGSRGHLGHWEGQADFDNLGVFEGFIRHHANAAFADVLNLPFHRACIMIIQDLVNTDFIGNMVQKGNTAGLTPIR